MLMGLHELMRSMLYTVLLAGGPVEATDSSLSHLNLRFPPLVIFTALVVHN